MALCPVPLLREIHPLYDFLPLESPEDCIHFRDALFQIFPITLSQAAAYSNTPH